MPTQKYLKKTRDLIGKFDSRIAHLQEEIDICAKYDHDLHRCLQEQKTQNLPLHQQYENLKEFSKSNYNPIAQSASRKLALLCKFRGILEKSTYDIGTAKKGLGSLNAIFLSVVFLEENITILKYLRL
ncbi:hypothetical protein Psal006b_03615 (plasmid) [Piscirickettsia salmonis]|uniref:hypothetical protein n=1 Tax=Piscirickettsia salmonis TaxID=1238 RepID=UPI0012B77C30|nr:hypothetical protein [Piscirickettsia salmonis]QGO00577.1 hypothetical protein Psal006b_03615 [Piscirickettsia salmonis]